MNSDAFISNIKVSHHIKSYEEKKALQQKKQLLCLVHHFLKDEGYFETATILCKEAPILNQYEVCDNIDLSTITQEFESYYYLRFQKYPKLCKKKDVNGINASSVQVKKNNTVSKKKETESVSENKNDTSIQKNNSVKSSEKIAPKLCDMDLTIIPLLTSYCDAENATENDYSQMPKPLSGFNSLPRELKDFAEAISREICTMKPNIHWNDIIGLDGAKKILKEAIVYPAKYPDLFSGILAPWNGLLLYGPPGTGKTLLAQAVATECKTTFFNISASSVVSKWRGDSEKLIRVMFQLARYHAPSTIFLDELDGLASHRDSSFEHEGSRRLKTELFIQLDGLSKSEEKIFVLATSNLPWELDAAIIRRLEKRILIGLPDMEERCSMFKHYLPARISKEPPLKSCVDYDKIAKVSEGYSGSDVKLVCKEATMQAMRPIFTALEQQDLGGNLPQLEVISTDDVEQALKRTKPTAQHVMLKYQEWQKAFGSM